MDGTSFLGLTAAKVEITAEGRGPQAQPIVRGIASQPMSGKDVRVRTAARE